jgi:hypothetical protein
MAKQDSGSKAKGGKGPLEFLSRLSPIAKLVLAVAVLALAAYLIVDLSRDKRPALALPEDFEAAFSKAALAQKDAPAIRLIPYAGEVPDAEILKNADAILLGAGAKAKALLDSGKIEVLPAPSGEGHSFPAALIAALSDLGGGKGLIGYPLAYDPYVMLWSQAYLGGPDASAPDRLEALLDAKGAAKAKSLVSLSASDDASLSSWLLYLGTADLKSAQDGTGPAAMGKGEKLLESLARAGLFQKAAFSYGPGDALALVLQGQTKAALLPLSSYYALSPSDAAKLIVAPAPLSSGATQTSAVAGTWVAARRSGSATLGEGSALGKLLLSALFQEAFAQAMDLTPANRSARFRDAAESAARGRAEACAAWLIPDPALLGDMAKKTLEDVRAFLRGLEMGTGGK